MINKYPLVLLEWEDSIQPRPSWMYISDFDNPYVTKCISVGWLIDDGEDTKSLAPNLGNPDNQEVAQASGIISIPTRCVTRLVKLKEEK